MPWLTSFPGSSGEEKRAWYPLLAHVFNRHKIPWLPDTTVQHSCYDNIDFIISLLLAKATHVSLFECLITHSLQHLGCEQRLSNHSREHLWGTYMYEGKDIFQLVWQVTMLQSSTLRVWCDAMLCNSPQPGWGSSPSPSVLSSDFLTVSCTSHKRALEDHHFQLQLHPAGQ